MNGGMGMQEYYNGFEDTYDNSYSYGAYDDPHHHNGGHGHGHGHGTPNHDVDSAVDGQESVSDSGASHSILDGDLKRLKECLVGDEFGRTGDSIVDAKPRILMMGPRRSGKTSIQQVVFRQMSPHETMFAIRHTEQIEVHDIQHSAFCNFTIWDYPGGVYGRPLLPHEEELGYHDIDSNTHPHLASHPSMTRQPSVYDGHTAYSVPQQQQQYQQYPPNTTSAGGNANVDTSTNMLPSSPQLTLQSQSQFQNSSTLDTSTTPLPTTNNTDHYDETYSRASAIVFVLDANDEPYAESIQGLMDIIKRATRANPNIHIEVFLHRIDGELFVSDDSKYDCRREVKQQVTDELQDFQMEGVNISYHLTSIFDHSIREAFSKVVQKLVPHQETMQDLLNSFCLTTRMEKALLFDLQSKLYLCADHNPADPPMTELSAEMIEVAIDVSGIYGQEEEGTVGNDDDQTRGTDGTVQGQESIQEGRTTDTEEEQGSSLTSTVVEENGAATMATATHHDALLGTMVGNMSRNELAEDVKQDDLDDTADYVDADNICLITLQNGQTLYLKEVDTKLALICWGPGENFRRRNLIDYNIGILKKAVRVLKRNPERT